MAQALAAPGNDSVVSVDLADEAKEIVVHNTANRPTKYVPSAPFARSSAQ
jgi:hypothetical protein